MSQDFKSGTWPNVAMRSIVESYIQPCLDAARTWFWGPTAPSNPAQGQPWADTTAGMLRIWDGATWVRLFPITTLSGVASSVVHLGTVAATGSVFILPNARTKIVVLDIALIAASGTTSTGSDHWSFQLTEVVSSDTLFETAPQTDVVGEVVADSPFVLAPDQNEELSAGSALKLDYAKTGSPGDLTNASVALTYAGLGV